MSKQLVCLHPSNQPPLLVQLVLEFGGEEAAKNVKVQGVGPRNCPVAQLKVNPALGEVLFGEGAISSYLARTLDLHHLTGKDAFEQVEVFQWVSFADRLSAAATDADLKDLDAHLALRSFFVGYSVSLADLAVWVGLFRHPQLFGRLRDQGDSPFPHLSRFLDFCSALPALAKYEKVAPKEDPQPKARGDAFLQLRGNPAKGQVVTRFPPEPSGYMHIGHCKAATLNSHYATAYEGKLIIRMDDTNPTAEKDEYSQAILEDLKSLGIKGHKFTHTSDHFDTIIGYCEKLLQEGILYVDGSTADAIKLLRDERKPSPFRDQAPEENLRLWKLMKEGDPEGTKYVVRAKIDYASDNGCLRDPNVFRCVFNTPHPRTGTKYKVYPLYDFACPIVDSIEGVTHALRSSEYHDRNDLYNWVLKACKLENIPIIEDFSRLNFTYTILSKRKLNWFVNKGLVDGWDDPCFPTVRGVLRRGLTVEALKKFILQQGSSKNLNLMDMGKLWALNKQIIDPIVPRFTSVVEPVKVKLSNFSDSEVRTRELHKKNPSLGSKVVPYSPNLLIDSEDAVSLEVGEEVTLMDWGNAIIESVEKDGPKVTAVGARLHLEGDFKTTKKKLTWLSDEGKDLLQVDLMECQPLLTKPKLEKEDNFEDFIPKELKIITAAVGEPALRLLQKGDKIQLERKGYFICDRPFQDFQEGSSSSLLLIAIPDGKGKK